MYTWIKKCLNCIRGVAYFKDIAEKEDIFKMVLKFAAQKRGNLRHIFLHIS